MNESLLGTYRLKPEHKNARFRVGCSSFGLCESAVVKVTQLDLKYSKVLIEFDSKSLDWFHYTILDLFEKE